MKMTLFTSILVFTLFAGSLFSQQSNFSAVDKNLPLQMYYGSSDNSIFLEKPISFEGKSLNNEIKISSNSDSGKIELQKSIPSNNSTPSEGSFILPGSKNEGSFNYQKSILDNPEVEQYYYSVSFQKATSNFRWSYDYSLSSIVSQLQANASAGYRIDDIDCYAGNRYAANWVQDGVGWAYIIFADYNTFVSYLNTYQNSYRIKDIEVHVTSDNQVKYSAVFKQDNRGWSYLINESNSTNFNNWCSQQQAAGRYVVDIDTYIYNGSIYYSGISASTNENGWAWVNNYTEQNFFAACQNYFNQGYTLNQIELIWSGSQYLYAGAWEKYPSNISNTTYALNQTNPVSFASYINSLYSASGAAPLAFNIYDGGTFVKVTNTSSVVPKGFTLSQNFPNPFNPVTNIKFEIPQNEFITLRVFDVTGKEVKELVNQSMNSGEYNVDFDGSNLESGIYFYRMSAGNYVETKKMILVK